MYLGQCKVPLSSMNQPCLGGGPGRLKFSGVGSTFPISLSISLAIPSSGVPNVYHFELFFSPTETNQQKPGGPLKQWSQTTLSLNSTSALYRKIIPYTGRISHDYLQYQGHYLPCARAVRELRETGGDRERKKSRRTSDNTSLYYSVYILPRHLYSTYVPK